MTGATGGIGRALAGRLVARGDRVIALVRDVDRARRILSAGITILRWERGATHGEWIEAIDGADGVIHLAGAPVAQRWSDEAKRAIRDSRVLGARSLVEAMAIVARRPEVFVSASAVGFYGTHPSNICTEDSEPGVGFLPRTCVEWENEALRAESLGVRVALVRCGIVLSMTDGALPRLLTPFRLFVGGPVASGRQGFPWIHIDDALGIYLWALDKPTVNGPVNAVAPETITNRDFGKALGRALGRPAIFRVPSFVLRLMLGSEAMMILAEGQFVLPRRTTTLGYRFDFTKVDQALRDLIDAPKHRSDS